MRTGIFPRSTGNQPLTRGKIMLHKIIKKIRNLETLPEDSTYKEWEIWGSRGQNSEKD